MPKVFIITADTNTESLLNYTEAFKQSSSKIVLCYGAEPTTGYKRVGSHFQKIGSHYTSGNEFLQKENNFTILFSIYVVTPLSDNLSLNAGGIWFTTGEPYNLLNHSTNTSAASIKELAEMLFADPTYIRSDSFNLDLAKLAANPDAMRNFLGFIEKRIAESGISIDNEVRQEMKKIFDVNAPDQSLKIAAEQQKESSALNVQPMVRQYNMAKEGTKEVIASSASSTNNNSSGPKFG